MVRLLIDLRRAIVVNQRRTSPVVALTTVALVAMSALLSLAVGAARYEHRATAVDMSALLAVLWIGGRAAQATLSGEATLRPELFGPLPIGRRRLAWSLLVVGLLDPINVVLAVALSGILVQGWRQGALAAITALVALVTTVCAASAVATLAGGLLGPGAGRGRDVGTLVTAVAISALAVAATMLPEIVAALRDRTAPWLSALLRVLPTGWAPVAVDEAGDGHRLVAGLALAGLVAVAAALALTWPGVLERRMHRSAHAPARAGASRHLPVGATPTGAVVAKELRMWGRDPLRITCLVIALVVGTAVGIVPRVTAGTGVVMPFAGTIATIIAAGCACNLYGNDGSSLWLTIVTPGASTVDVRGRQLAWLIVVAPYAVIGTVALTAISDAPGSWPAALALLAATLGGGAGLVPLASLVAVTPLDDAGNPTPAWSLKVHVAVLAVAIIAVPTGAVVLVGPAWAGLALGVVTGVVSSWGLPTIAIHRLRGRAVPILGVLT